MKRRIRVLIIEDSLFMAEMLRAALKTDAEIETIGTAKTGLEALALISRRRPDVVTLDILLPDIDGLALLRKLVESALPVIVVSNVSPPESALALRALDMGAVGCIAKPRHETAAFAAELGAQIRKAARSSGDKTQGMPAGKPTSAALGIAKTVVVMGASAGGPLLIREIVLRLPADLAAGVLIILHMPSPFTKQFVADLAAAAKIRVKEAQPGDIFLEGTVLVAGGDKTVKAEWIGDGVGAVALSSIAPMHFGFQAWIDAAMATTALLYGRRTIGVLLSGMGSDGVEGLRLIRRAGGRALVQDEPTSVVFGMPKAAIEAGLADRVLPAQKIADAIIDEVAALSGLRT